VAQFEGEGGNLVTLVATSGDDTLRQSQRSLLKPGEVEVKMPEKGMHAEAKLLKAAKEFGLDPSKGRIGASRPVCPDCARILKLDDVNIESSLKE
jgi:hypothetical protein